MTFRPLAEEYPVLWAAAKNADDDRERLGLTVGQNDDGAACVLRELTMACESLEAAQAVIAEARIALAELRKKLEDAP